MHVILQAPGSCIAFGLPLSNMKYNDKFIEDLIPLILDADDHWWQSHLATLAIVSQGWLYYVRKRLYACPDIRTVDAARKLANTLEENEYLGWMVSGIILLPGLRNEPALRLGGGIKAIRMLLGLEGLRKITIGGDINRCLGLVGNPEGVEELQIRGQRELGWPTTVEWDERLTFGFPRLKKMALREIDLDVMWPTVGHPASFTELILEDVAIVGGRLTQMLNGAQRLRCLHISGSDMVNEEAKLKEVLRSCAVECLHYEVRKTSGRWNPFSDLGPEGGRTVRCLHLEGHLLDSGILDTLQEVFWNVEELVVSGRTVNVLAREWAELLSSGGLSSLKRIGLPWGTNKPPFVKWNKTEEEAILVEFVKRKLIVM